MHYFFAKLITTQSWYWLHFRNQKVHYFPPKSMTLDHITSQLHQVHKLATYFCKSRFNIYVSRTISVFEFFRLDVMSIYHGAPSVQLTLLDWNILSESSEGCNCNTRERAKCGHESRGTRNQEWLCWRQPTAIYLSVFLYVRLWVAENQQLRTSCEIMYSWQWRERNKTLLRAVTKQRLLKTYQTEKTQRVFQRFVKRGDYRYRNKCL
jgi:hypothetical protein